LEAARSAVTVEFAIRVIGALAIVLFLGTAGLLPSTPQPWPFATVWTTNVLLAGLAVVVLGVIYQRRVTREGLNWVDLGYRWSTTSWRVSLLASLALVVVVEGTSRLDAILFGNAMEATVLRMIAAAGPLVGVLLLVANGIGAPFVEEMIWRGYVQTKLAIAWGGTSSLLATAAIFTGKHVIVDLSIDRIVTLFSLSLALGYMRYRWGTWASTVVHLAVNLAATGHALYITVF